MKKILIITAHPSTQGFTHSIASSFKEGAKSKGNQVEVLDLYKTDLQIPFLNFENKDDMRNLSDHVKQLQQKITECSDMVFIHPLWWMGTPAIMKNFFDNVFTSHFAFKYVDGKPVGLLKDKNAHIFFTCDGNMWWFKTAIFLLKPIKFFWSMGLLHFCGLKHKTMMIFDKSFKRSEKDRNMFLKRVNKIARGL
jgi:NAD(P)H dehydrogenase (quinone)